MSSCAQRSTASRLLERYTKWILFASAMGFLAMPPAAGTGIKHNLGLEDFAAERTAMRLEAMTALRSSSNFPATPFSGKR